MRYEDENIWLTQKMMAALYDVDVRTINEHIRKIYADEELTEGDNCPEFPDSSNRGSRQVNRQLKHYNLRMIIAVGFKVNNDRAIQFRKWANAIVKDYTIQGWAMDSDRLKNGEAYSPRSTLITCWSRSVKFACPSADFIKKITDIYATALDYDRSAKDNTPVLCGGAR